MTRFPWPTRSLGELFSIGVGKSVTPASRGGPNRHPFLRTSNVLWGRIDLTTVDEMHFTADELREKALASGDLLVCEGGEVGRAAVWSGELKLCAFQNHLHRLRPRSSKVVPQFFVYALEAGFRQLGSFEGVANRTTIPNLSRSRLAQLDVPVPPKREQEQIAGVLRRVQGAAQTQESLLTTTRELKQAAMQQLFTRGLRKETQEETEIGPVPESWRVESLGTLCERPQYGVTASANPNPVGPKFLRITDLTDLGVHWEQVPYCECSEQEAREKRLAEHDIVFARIGATTGKSYIVKNPPFAVFASYLIRVRAKGEIDPDFLYHFFQSEPYWEQINANKKNNLKGGVSGSILASLRVPVPSLSEQQEIAAILEAIDQKVVLHARKASRLRELFDTLLYDLMTGRLPITGLDLSAISDDDGNSDALARSGGLGARAVRVFHQRNGDNRPDVAELAPAERLAMMWQLARDAWAFTSEPERAESRLQRHAVRVHRRER